MTGMTVAPRASRGRILALGSMRQNLRVERYSAPKFDGCHFRPMIMFRCVLAMTAQGVF